MITSFLKPRSLKEHLEEYNANNSIEQIAQDIIDNKEYALGKLLARNINVTNLDELSIELNEVFTKVQNYTVSVKNPKTGKMETYKHKGIAFYEGIDVASYISFVYIIKNKKNNKFTFATFIDVINYVIIEDGVHHVEGNAHDVFEYIVNAIAVFAKDAQMDRFGRLFEWQQLYNFIMELYVSDFQTLKPYDVVTIINKAFDTDMLNNKNLFTYSAVINAYGEYSFTANGEDLFNATKTKTKLHIATFPAFISAFNTFIKKHRDIAKIKEAIKNKVYDFVFTIVDEEPI